MHRFKKGDFVKMGIPEDVFRSRASANSSSRNYIDYIAKGGIVEVVNKDDNSVQLLMEGRARSERSNWFKMDWFELADMTLHKIKQESQRL